MKTDFCFINLKIECGINDELPPFRNDTANNAKLEIPKLTSLNPLDEIGHS